MSNRKIALCGAPNVGKSTVFNELTGSCQHTGNWIGKTVELASSTFYYKYNEYTVVDLPGTYSLNASSKEEEVAQEFIENESLDCIVCVVDCSLLERSLPLVFQIMSISNKVVVMLNLCDEAKKHGIFVDHEKLSALLGVPVVKATARSGKGINSLLEQIHLITTNAIHPCPEITGDSQELAFIKAKAIANQVITVENTQKQNKLDKIMLGKFTSFLSMIVIFAIVLWITITGSNYPSEILKNAFDSFEIWLADGMQSIGISSAIIDLTVFGILRVLLWVVSVMLPPMAIFFPAFALMEDFGILPRLAFNLDYCFEKCGACGKQALTCCMGLGCNAVGVTGTRIIDSPRERLIAIITNSLTPCNGRFPLLIAIIGMFFCENNVLAALILLCFLGLSLSMTMLSSKILSKTVLKGESSSFVMELPNYRKPKFFKTIWQSIREKVILVLFRAIYVAAPAGLIIWIMANIHIGGNNLLIHMSNFLDPIGQFMGLDGVMLMAFILSFPANEILIPIALMAYLSTNNLGDYSSLSSLKEILMDNGWTITTAICTCVFSLFHFPCSTTLLTIFKETKSIKWTLLSVATPLTIGFVLCVLINLLIPS